MPAKYKNYWYYTRFEEGKAISGLRAQARRKRCRAGHARRSGAGDGTRFLPGRRRRKSARTNRCSPMPTTPSAVASSPSHFKDLATGKTCPTKSKIPPPRSPGPTTTRPCSMSRTIRSRCSTVRVKRHTLGTTRRAIRSSTKNATTVSTWASPARRRQIHRHRRTQHAVRGIALHSGRTSPRQSSKCSRRASTISNIGRSHRHRWVIRTNWNAKNFRVMECDDKPSATKSAGKNSSAAATTC